MNANEISLVTKVLTYVRNDYQLNPNHEDFCGFLNFNSSFIATPPVKTSEWKEGVELLVDNKHQHVVKVLLEEMGLKMEPNPSYEEVIIHLKKQSLIQRDNFDSYGINVDKTWSLTTRDGQSFTGTYESCLKLSLDRFEVEVIVNDADDQPVIQKELKKLIIEYYLDCMQDGMTKYMPIKHRHNGYKFDRGIPFGVAKDYIMKYSHKIGN
jgi:hypothetical protein